MANETTQNTPAGSHESHQNKLSKPQYGVLIAKDVMVPMRDGVRLAADLYFPAIDGKAVEGRWPSVMQRTPYNKSDVHYGGHAEYFCKRGYVGIIMDCRGRFNSEGDYYHFIYEAEDGYDTCEWVGRQTWSDGRIGTFGVSYGSQVQSAMATQNPKNLTAMIPTEGPSNIYEYGLRHDGAFQLKFLTAGFWFGLMSQEARDNPAIKKALESARMGDWLWRLPLKRGQSPLALIPNYESFVIDFMTRGDHEPFWDQPGFNIEAHYDEHSDVPTYLVCGLVRLLAARHVHPLHGALPAKEGSDQDPHGTVDSRRRHRRVDVFRRRGFRPRGEPARQPGRTSQRLAAALVRPVAQGHRQRRGRGAAGEDVRDGRRQRTQERRRTARPRGPLA